MGWPDWIDALREHYLADHGNVFLLHGALGATFDVDGEPLDVIGALVRFLGRTRQIIGVLRPDEPLSFPHMGDQARFERMVNAREVVTGQRLPRDSTVTEDQLGLIWTSLCGTGVDQAFLVTDLDRILPGHRKRVEPIGADAPPLWEWPRRLHQSNDIVVLLAPTPELVRAEVVEAAVVIEVAPPAPPRRIEAPDVHADARSAADAEMDAMFPDGAVREPASPPPPPADSAPDGDELGDALADALQRTLPMHPVATWPSRLPVLHAVAVVLADVDDRVGLIELALDDDGRPVGTGPGADWFFARWRADVALDAAAGMLLNGIEVPDGADHVTGPVPLDATAMSVLIKRLRRVLSQA